MTNATRNRCPACGKYLEDDPQGYYDKIDRSDDMAPAECFCNEACANSVCRDSSPDDDLPEGHAQDTLDYMCDGDLLDM